MSSNKDIDSIISGISDDQLDAVFDLVNDIRLEEEINPISKFKTDRADQLAFIGNEHKINIALCGNQWGKSMAMAYKVVSIATGVDKGCRHQPDPTRDLEIVVIGPTWSKITETIQKDIINLLRKDQYHTKSNGTYINKMIINGPGGSKTKVLFMPSSVDKKQDSQEFEGSRYHYAFVDEGISPDLFRKILIRLGSQKGYFYQAFTRLPETLHLCQHLIDLEKGQGDFKYLIDMGLVNIIKAATIDNKYLDEEEKSSMMIGAGNGLDIKLYEKYSKLSTLETNYQQIREDLLRQMSANFKARILGIIDKPKGSVFNFREYVNNKPYNMFSMIELASIMMVEEGRWDICHDYGQSRPATWILCWTSLKTGTIYIIDEVYQTDMSLQQSAESCYELMQRWECYGQVKCIFADKQIRDAGRRDNRTDSQLTIEQQYKAKFTLSGDPCFPSNIQWICRQTDKNNKLHTISTLAEMIDEENPLTPGLPYIRISHKCVNTVNELRMLRWSTKIHKQSGAEYEDTDGEDHAIDPIRYMINNKVNYQVWSDRFRRKAEFNELSYSIGGSGNPLFML